MRKLIPTLLMAGSFFISLPAEAKVIEQSCICQGHARSGGLNISGIPGTWLENIHRAAVHYCQTGEVHQDIIQRQAYGARSGGVNCAPAACPAGTVDLGVVTQKCSGVSKSRYTPGTETSNTMAPAEGGCNYDDSNPNPNYQFVSCDLQCDLVRRCATATSN